MRGIVLVLLLVGVVMGETFVVSPGETFTLGLKLVEGVTSKINMSSTGTKGGLIEIKNPEEAVMRRFTNESNISMSFVPEVTGTFWTVVANTDVQAPMVFSIDLPKSNEGPFATQTESNLGKKLEEQLRDIITAHKSLLYRQSIHLQQAKNTKGWIKKLTVLEIVSCVFVLIYVHKEAVKTFYGTRKV
ncbi:hypothetical protein NEOKW01_0523 [Nematocida sp. AWRm80]|nr:hypothetical protein NEOKW01_0523 [Nematocida sp. AWRm80]